MSVDRERISFGWPSDSHHDLASTCVTKHQGMLVYGCIEIFGLKIEFSDLNTQQFLIHIFQSKPEGSTTILAKVNKIVLLSYQLTKISKFFDLAN